MDTSNFNIGKFLDCVYLYWNRAQSKSVFFNDLIRVFLTDSMPDFELDKASVSKLRSHEYDLKGTIKKEIEKAKDKLAPAFLEVVSEAITCSPDVLASSIAQKLLEAEEKESESIRFLVQSYEKKEFDIFLFRSFKHAAAMNNLPQKAKAKSGRKPRGSFHSVFYLSEEEKRFEKNRLLTKIFNSNDTLTKTDFDELLELMAYARLSFSPEEKNKVALRFLRKWPGDEKLKPGEDFLEEMDMCQTTYGPKVRDRFVGWETAVSEAEVSIALASFPATYRKAMRQNSFADLDRALDSILANEKVVSSEALATMLVNNDFYLPHFTKHISHSIWSYCLAMAKLAKRAKLEEKFFKVLDSVLAENPGNYTVMDRIEALKDTALGKRIY